MTRMHCPEERRPYLPLTAIVLVLSTVVLQTVSAQTAPSLGTAASFAVLAGSTATNTGPTVINGNLGVSPGSAVTGFPPGTVVPPGTIHMADAVAAGAQSDNTIAYNALAGQTCNFNLTGQDLGGLTLIPGVYCFASTAQLTGALTLDARGNTGAVFIFQIGTTLTTASNSSVKVINGGSGCNLFWQIGSSATLGTTTSFIGNILALTSITLDTGATVSGRALAQNGAVTLDSSNVSLTDCNASFVAQPAIVNAFGLAAIGVGGTATKSFTINNPNATVALSGVAFTDTLPASLVVSTPNGVTGGCDAGTIIAVAGSGTISLTGATLLGGASCTFSVNVTGTAQGTYSNSATVTSSNGGTGNTSTASLTVLPTAPAIGPPTILKTFGAAGIGVGGTTTLAFTIHNPNATVALTGVAFTDTLPAGLAVSTPNGVTGGCDAGTVTAVAGSGTVSLTGATLLGGASCTFSVNVTGATAGAMSNSVSVRSSNGGTGNTSTASLNVVAGVIAPPTISKSFGTTLSIPGGTAALSFTVNNPNATVALNGVAFTDTFPAGLVVATPNGVTGSCGGGLITATAGSGSISLTGATLAPGASCTLSVNVTATSNGVLINITGNVISSNGGLGNTALAQIVVGEAFLVKYVTNLQAGDSFINITNTGAAGAGRGSGTSAAITGSLCVNVYAFEANEEIVSCCSCAVTPNGLVSLSARRDIAANSLFNAGTPTSLIIKLVATAPVGGSCVNSAAAVAAGTLSEGMAAWGTTLHANKAAGTYAVTETPFTPATLSTAELARLAYTCGVVQYQGSGYGQCNACRLGGSGAAAVQQ